MSHADYADVHYVRAIEYVADEVDQDFDVVSLFRIARKSDQHQVPADLYGGQSVYSGQDVGKDVGDTLIMARH